ncbi:MAG: acetyl-CoA hydrolase/transferase family protein [Leptospiraceae bacterium]|nr:acetyl-CoA hydrolase/transferase family protein [Leptospiraceae bacterium]MCB1319848.1 acetyl-CoA hydrolase/transferase family protein [Leptospiraceae bacterium]
MNWKDRYERKKVSAAEAVRQIQSGHRIFLDGNAAMPGALVEALLARAHELENVELNHLLVFGNDPFKDSPQLRANAWFLGPGVRKAVNEGRADYIPIFLSEITALVRSGNWPIDVALINVSPPDRYGFMSYGIEVSVTKPATEQAKLIIAQVNERMPRAHGDCFIHVNDVHYFVEKAEEPLEIPAGEPGPVERQIGENVANLIENGSTLQMGIGGIPNAVLASLHNKHDLGIHTEMFSDGILSLLDSGVINNQMKGMHRGKVISSFAMGTRELYDYISDNPYFEFHPSHYTNDPFIISRNNKMVAINCAIEVDLTGQVCADSIGSDIYSGIGGQVDFIRGAARSPGGKPIIALPSTAKGGSVSRIAPLLTPGAGVVTSRGDVHYVVTEFGVANLFGKNLRQRAEALINIAHPDFRAELRKEARWLNL